MTLISLIFEGIVALGAIFAFLVYFLNNRNRQRTAATIVLIQIDEIEKTLENMKMWIAKGDLRSEVLYELNRYSCDAWDTNKHLLIKKLNTKDYESIGMFYVNVKNILNALNDLIILLNTAWEAKQYYIAESVAKFINDGKTDNETQEFLNKYSGSDFIFTPTVSMKSLVVNMHIYTKMSGTTAYANLRKASYKRRLFEPR